MSHRKTNYQIQLFQMLLLAALLGFLTTYEIYSQSQNTTHTLKLDQPQNMPAAVITDVSWLAGHYGGEAFGGTFEEVWAPPKGKTMMGMFKVVRGDSIMLYEFLTISPESNSLTLKLKHFHSDLKGWEEQDEFVAFPLVKITEEAIFWDGLTFKKLDEDTVQVYLALEQQGQTNEVAFRYQRVKGSAKVSKRL